MEKKNTEKNINFFFNVYKNIDLRINCAGAHVLEQILKLRNVQDAVSLVGFVQFVNFVLALIN